MQVSVKPLKQVDIVSVTGRIDSGTAPDFETTLKGLIDRGRKKIVIDLGACDYVSSAGLRAMLSTLKLAKHGISAGNVVLTGTNERIRDTLELVGFHTLFTQYDDLVDAVDSF